MTVAQLLTQRSITSALVIDDAYDDVPRATDTDEEAWANFFDDIRPDADKVDAVYPGFLDARDDLRRNDGFVAAVWQVRATLDQSVVGPLFASYEQGRESDRTFLTTLETALSGLGLQVTKSGRDLPVVLPAVDIVFADLFLGTPQADPDMDRSIGRLNQLLENRRDNPPLVILMSKSELLKEKRGAFRDRAGLVGAMFRVYSKNDLANSATLERAVERLASYRPDALRVVAFLKAWEQGIEKATSRFMSGIRRLDLTDYAQIQQILLEFEGQPLGSYLLDVFDRVFQHELEGDNAIITAASGLNTIETAKYPAPHIAGSADLQDLTYRSIWQHPERLAVPASVEGAPVSFGDLLVSRAIVTGQVHAGEEPQALLAMTPACDLLRDRGAKRILFLAGTLSKLEPASWTYDRSTPRTPIVILDDERRFWIRWAMKDLRLLTMDEVRARIAENGAYVIHRRLRESHALELQQAMLADMGRVGVLVQMPATFPVSVEALRIDANDAVQTFGLPALSRDGGVCYSGRGIKQNETVTRLVLTEEAADALAIGIQQLAEDDVHEKARPMLRNLKVSTFFADLQTGTVLPAAVSTGGGRLKASKGGQQVDVAYLMRNPTQAFVPDGSNRQAGALVLVLRDLDIKTQEAAAPTPPEVAPGDQVPPAPEPVAQ